MPPPKKLDLIDPDLRQWLFEELQSRGFAQIEEVTEALNCHLEERGEEIRVGKTAVGEFSKQLKDQRVAFAMAETLLSDMDVEAESDLHKMLLHMIATSAAQMIKHTRDQDQHLDAKDLMGLGRMLKDLMSSAGIREKLLEDERKRVAREAREAALAEAAESVAAEAKEAGLSEDQADKIRKKVLGLKT